MVLLQFIFSFNLILLALDHILTGALAVFSPKIALKFYKIIFGADVPMLPGHLFILKPWGALGVFAGMIGLLPVFDPLRYEPVLWILIILLAFRIYIRLTNSRSGEVHLQMNQKRNLVHIGLILLCASIILLQIYTIG